MAAAELAAAGARVVLLDEKLAWEKPCGGGVTYKAWTEYPFLAASPAPRKTVRVSHIAAPGAGKTALRLDQPILIFSRRDLNRSLLDRAEAAGVQLERTRVLAMERRGPGWNIRTRAGSLDAEFCVVATGARNPFREVGTEWTAADTMSALGYYVEADRSGIDIEFLEGLEGYIWVFPRCGHLSVGICGKGEPAHSLRARLERYMAAHDLDFHRGQFYAHMLPALDTASWKKNRVSGDGWIAVGDAAGLVDPITGEGIYYAIRSGDLAARALAADPSRAAESYRAAVDSDFAHDLSLASRIARRVYLGRFLFGAIPARMVQFTRRSPKFRAVMQDLFAGTQAYDGLSRRLWRNLGGTLRETALSFAPLGLAPASNE